MNTKRTLRTLTFGVLAGLTMAAQAADIQKTWVDTEAGSPTGPYLVIDLTSRRIAVGEQPDRYTPPKTVQGFVVSNLPAVPPGGWTDEHKTTKLVLRRIPAGTFTMGSPADELGRDPDEAEHSVKITRDFYIGVFEVTMKQWEVVMGSGVPGHYHRNLEDPDDEPRLHISGFQRRPVERITFHEIRENPAKGDQPGDDPDVDWPANNAVHPDSFFGKLRAKSMLAGLDLPTEAQWEYACRAGTTTALNSGKTLTRVLDCPNMTELGRYMANHDPPQWWWSRGWVRLWSTVVGAYAPNMWGLYDMHGNVWEWCLDWYAPLPSEAVTDPKGPPSGEARVIRGGGWDERAAACRSANRGIGGIPSEANPFFGFRVVLTLQ